MSEQTTYTAEDLGALAKPDLEKIANERGLEVTGTGANGNVLVPDLTNAILDAQAAAADAAPASPPEQTGNPPSTEPVPPPADAGDAEPGDRRPIERTSGATGAWWCPFCDTSHESRVGTCRCGAQRDGDDAVKP